MRYLLFTTPTCPKCPLMKEAVETLPFSGLVCSSEHSEFPFLTEKYNVTSAPVLIITHHNKEIGRCDDLSTFSDLKKQCSII